MRHFKHYCKLIISTIAVVLVFACHSLVSYADPLTAAMIGSGAAMGFGFPGISGLSPSSVGTTYDIGYSDPVPWDSISHKSINVVTNPDDSNNVDITLNQDITSAGNYRINQLNDYYGLTPGSFHTIGNYLAYNGYIFNNSIPSTPANFIGSSIGSVNVGHYAIDSSVYFDVFENASKLRYNCNIGSYSYTNGPVSSLWTNQPIYFCVQTNYDPYKLCFAILKTNNSFAYVPSEAVSGLTVTSSSPAVSRSQDSTLIQSQDYENKITLPKSYLNNISYTPGDVTDVSTIEQILDQILDAVSNDDILVSVLNPVTPVPTPTTPPAPTPVPGDTIANTPYSILNDVFDDFKEVFGDIYDGISDFQESFGDWVDDVASGWTEVFGDIYSTLQGISGTVSGTISSTLQAILSAIQSLVQTIENADFQFIDAFWKNFLTPFNSLFNTIKSHLSIWHYVVEWLASISSVFTFYLGVFSGAGSGYLLPIYACFAGTVVIAVYKRFGK